jgi:VPDSG-CTERM motif
MKTLFLAAIRCSLMFTAVTAPLFFVRPAQAYIVTLHQVGSNVVANGSRAINLTGLTFLFNGGVNAELDPSSGAIITAPFPGIFDMTAYTGFTGPSSFGSGSFRFPDSGSFDLVGVLPSQNRLFVPRGYVSGAALSDSMTFDNATFASLGVTPGAYVWSWGSGANQNFTLQIGSVGVPDGGSTVSLLACALFGLAALRRKLGR